MSTYKYINKKSHYNNSVNGSLSFNKYDTPKVKICFSNLSGRTLTMNVGNTVYRIDRDGCTEFDLSNTSGYYAQIEVDLKNDYYPRVEYNDIEDEYEDEDEDQTYNSYGSSSGNYYQMGY